VLDIVSVGRCGDEWECFGVVWVLLFEGGECQKMWKQVEWSGMG
jgi:hypothetical protein